METFLLAVVLPTVVVAAVYALIRWRRSRKVTIHAEPSYHNTNYEQLLGRVQRDGQLSSDEQISLSMSYIERHGFVYDHKRVDTLRREHDEEQRRAYGEPDLVDGLIGVAGAVATHAALSAVVDSFTSDSTPDASDEPSAEPDRVGGGGGGFGGGGASGDW